MVMHQNFINGRFETVGGEGIPVLNPARDTVISEIPDTSADAVDQAVAAAKKAQTAWEKLPAIERAGHLRQISAKIRENADEIARVISEEQGKILRARRRSRRRSPRTTSTTWPSGRDASRARSSRATGRARTILLFRQPIGVVGGILPWNFPFFLIARKMAPALITGNTIVIKPQRGDARTTPPCSRELVTETDLPTGVFNIVYGRGGTTGRGAVAPSGRGMISFTGSVETGSKIMADCAKNITKVNLELGGKAPGDRRRPTPTSTSPSTLHQAVAGASTPGRSATRRAGLRRASGRRRVRSRSSRPRR